MQSSIEAKRQFLLSHPNYIIDHVSLRFSLTHDQLRRYRKILSWDLIVCNHSIAWNTKIIDDFITELFPELGPYDLPEFSWNRALPWDSIEFVKRYEHLWNWQAIAENNMLKGECRDYYLGRLMQYDGFELEPNKNQSFATIEIDLLDHLQITANNGTISKELEKQQKDFHDFLMHHPEIAIVEVNWEELSDESRMHWTEELVAKYEELWNWDKISQNPSLPWSIGFMKRYEDRFNWGNQEEVDDSVELSTICDPIGFNDGIDWTVEMFDAFHHKLQDDHDIASNSSTKWTLQLLNRYIEIWGSNSLYYYHNIWNSLFKEFEEDEMWMGVLDELL